MSAAMTMKWDVKFSAAHKGRKMLALFKEQEPSPEKGRIPRVSRLMALAIKMDRMIRDGAVKDYAELGRLGKVTRARISQIMGLLNLAPDIQEEVLFLPRVVRGREPIQLADMFTIARDESWAGQRKAWAMLWTIPARADQ